MNNLSKNQASHLAATLTNNLASALMRDSAEDFTKSWEQSQPASSLYYSVVCGVLFPITAIGILMLLSRL